MKRAHEAQIDRRPGSALLSSALALLALLGVAASLHAEPVSPLPRAARQWVDATLESMGLEEKAAQMVMIRTHGRYQHPRSASAQRLLHNVRQQGVGGVIVFDSDLESIPSLLDRLQNAAEVPLLVASDLERGLAFRVRRGTVPLPYAMAVGATRSPEAARFFGEVTAREARALGIHWGFAPVADVNNNPANPIINIRSFGEQPELVAQMTRAFVEGARSGGLLTTVKHFPGHGDTAIDSHVALPTVEADQARLEAVELVPFRAAVEAGVDAVMLGHIAVPALDPSGAPATLSPALSGGLLRDTLGFEGLIVTDAMEMAGVRPAWAGGAAIRAVQAGADVILLPPDTRVAIESLVRAVDEGQITEARLDLSVQRILEAKARFGLHRERTVDRAAIEREVARPEDVAGAAEIARDSITVVRNEGGVLPLRAEQPLRLLHLVISGRLSRHGLPQDELEARRVAADTFYLGPEVSAETAREILTAAESATHVLITAYVRVSAGAGAAPQSPSHARLLHQLRQASDRPMIAVSFGSPYLLASLPAVEAYVCAYGAVSSSQRAAMAALFGEAPVSGRLPVTLPGDYPYGHGLDIPRREMTLRRARPEEVGFRAGGMAAVDQVIDRFLAEKAFPGGVLAVGRRGALVYLRPFGKLSYDAEAAAVSADTIYDLASLTKVLATTTMTMVLVD
ncbi:MAG: glycoside hydrolase family 3 N-terminal domain-containing protein, partial [Acidobacteriota bacterium]